MRIDREVLAVIHALSEEETVPVEEARFIQPYSARMLDVFRQMARFPKLDAAIPKTQRTVSTATGTSTVEVPMWQMSDTGMKQALKKTGRSSAKRLFEQRIK